MGGINFACLVVIVLSPDWLSRQLGVSDFPGVYVNPTRLGGGSAGRAPNLRIIPWHLPYNCG